MQTREDRKQLLDNLSEGVRRVLTVGTSGKQAYKRPDEVDLDNDEVVLNGSGIPIVMKGTPGRRKKAVLSPISTQVAEVCQAREEHVASDPLISTVRISSESDKVLESILTALAEDAAVIDFEKEEAFRNGASAANLATKRARILKGMSDIWLRKKSLSEGGVIDLDSPVFKEVFSLLLETFRGVLLESGVPPEHVETVFAKLISSFDDAWKEDARRRMRQASR